MTSTAPTRCTRPGCDGDIDDGFCDTCGRPQPAAGSASPDPGPSTAAAASKQGPGAGPATAATGTSGTGPATAAGAVAPGPGSGSGSTPSGRSGSTRTGSGRGGSGRTRSGSSRRRIGAGLVPIEPEPAADPAEAVLADPVVPESSRHCGACDAPVGRGRDGRPGRTEGFCPQCGTRFSFTPGLAAGDLVADQYEVLGCLAHGGLGWIYLARDRKVRDRWVVLKGLLNTGDAAALAAADAEQGFLAQLVHPRIVRIYNVVTGAGDEDAATYIVMEYIGGRSLKAMRDPRTPMSPEPALAYVLEVLPALSHMHERGLLYCDFKPDNVVQTGTEVTLIDLGAVRRIDDPGGDVWGTVGYQAPEISPEGAGPSVASDVYTVGRTIAVLVANFDFHGSMRDVLPLPDDAPALEHEPLRRLLDRATALEPTERFGSIDELADQIVGVLRQLTAEHTTPPPRLSTMFAAPPASVGIDAPATPGELAAALPAPLPDPDDPSTPELVAAAAQGPRAVLAAVSAEGALDTDQARLSAVAAHLDAGDTDAAGAALDEHAVLGEWTWTWLRARHAAATGAEALAARLVDQVSDALPGELAPQFALAVLGEHRTAGDDGGVTAERFARIWRTDRTWTGAAFALARLRVAADDRAGAVEVLDEVPPTSVHAADARVAAVRVLLGAPDLTRSAVMEAGARTEAIEVDPLRAAELQTEVLEAYRRTAGPAEHADGALFGCSLDDDGLGFGLEERYRLRARFAPTLAERFALVDAANDARPWTAR
ncbi:tetratricopeptide repeat protein [Actinomycetospora termitidis]|uniref:non-specific serine/threonine protein kinase n=1 Tax=Actinomycetospora termitidis TaxID=3053470 RepID=A0ABT7MDT3_9PSEU|nr:tetratricopeptide repeat protein [Actinomycetospora sp. Odt1-22]MDL5158828.1 tetratricopeptide repeat protein [Actinomycetospora sp. Odt1-22]